MGTCTYQIEWWQDPQKKVSQIPSKRNELQASLKILGYFSPKWKVVLYHYNIFLFISKLNYDLTFGNHPSEIILRYASDYPPAPYTSISFGTPQIILRRLVHPPPSVRLGLSSGALFILLLRYASDYPPAPYSLTNENMPCWEIQFSPPKEKTFMKEGGLWVPAHIN